MSARAVVAAFAGALVTALLGAAPARAFEVVADGRPQQWQMLESAARPWKICALLPQARDKYWWGVAWGLHEEGRRLRIDLGIYQANSYADLALQRRQWADCAARGADAFILAAISADGLNAEIAQALKDGKPVIDLVNGVSAETTSRSLVSFEDMAGLSARYVQARLADAKRRASVAWFPGPADAGWVRDGERGFTAALADAPIELRHGGFGPTDASNQATLLRTEFERRGAPDVIVGNAVAIEFAVRYLAGRPGSRPQLVSYYATEDIVAQIANGTVLAAPTDQPVVQARIAVDLAVRALEGQRVPRRVSPEIVMLDRAMLARFDLRRVLPPKGTPFIQQGMGAGR